MPLNGKLYVPTLAVRASEMNGLEFLPGATKNRMTPCFLLAPWANSSSLERAVDRIERAFASRHYFLDIDRDYQFTNLESDPQQELAALLDPKDNFQNWVQFVEQHEWVWPCLQTRGQTVNEIRSQIDAFQQLGRTYCFRIVRDRFPENIDEIVSALSASGSADYVVILEGGWSRDPLSLAVWFSGVVSGSLQEIDAEVPIIISCTSIPKMFTAFNGISEVPFSNRQLFDQIQRATNRVNLIYGDWGSTRPREPNGFANRPLDRVDYPTNNNWLIARSKDDDWSFSDAAGSVVSSDAWDGTLGIWGEEMILQTAVNANLGINTPQKNVASRVNIHLHRQAFFDEPNISGLNFDEDWQD